MMLTCGDVVVELRGFEPLTPCMPLTSQPLTTHHLPPRYLISTLLNSVIAGPAPASNETHPWWTALLSWISRVLRKVMRERWTRQCWSGG